MATCTYLDYEKILSMSNDYQPRIFNLMDLVKWEESNLIEMVYVKCKDRLYIGRIHYLKKEFVNLFSIPLNRIQDAKWSPEGKYLIVNEGTVC